MVQTWTGSTLGTFMGTWSYSIIFIKLFVFRTDQNKADFTSLMQEMSAAFKAENLLFSVAVSANLVTAVQLYDVQAISDAVDWMNIKYDYDYHETIIK